MFFYNFDVERKNVFTCFSCIIVHENLNYSSFLSEYEIRRLRVSVHN